MDLRVLAGKLVGALELLGCRGPDLTAAAVLRHQSELGAPGKSHS